MAFPTKEWDNLIYENSKLSLTLLILMFVIVVIALCIYVILILRAAKREMILWAARVKQLECTQQAECKSMNKSLAFAKATHDIRNSLTAIADLIDICQKDVAPNSELARKITQIKTCTKDLIGQFTINMFLVFLYFKRSFRPFIFKGKEIKMQLIYSLVGLRVSQVKSIRVLN